MEVHLHWQGGCGTLVDGHLPGLRDAAAPRRRLPARARPARVELQGAPLLFEALRLGPEVQEALARSCVLPELHYRPGSF